MNETQHTPVMKAPGTSYLLEVRDWKMPRRAKTLQQSLISSYDRLGPTTQAVLAAVKKAISRALQALLQVSEESAWDG